MSSYQPKIMNSTLEWEQMSLTRYEKPSPNDNIVDDLMLQGDQLRTIREELNILEISTLTPENDVYKEGKWLVEFHFKDGALLIIALPISMTMDEVRNYCKPLLDKLKEHSIAVPGTTTLN